MTTWRTRLDRLKTVVGIGTVLVMVLGVGIPAEAGTKADERESIVVKVDPGVDIDRLAAAHDARVVEAIVASRGIYALGPLDPTGGGWKKAKDVAKAIARTPGVDYAELDANDVPTDDRFHAWPEGLPTFSGVDPDEWLDQVPLDYLQLDAVHRISTGAGVVVAVLDTGADLDHPYLEGHLASGGYDFVDDDDHPDDTANGIDDDGDGQIDESYGHGTHTSGLVALVAPDAEILVYRVLDSDGAGNAYAIVEAIDDALAAGADVINLSFGMGVKSSSKIVKEAFKRAARQGVPIVAAVGNDGVKQSQYPASEKDVIGVGAATRGNRELAAFSNYGKAALVAAPGESIVSTLPGGGFGRWSGTSMATPIVTGQVALVRSHDPDRRLKHILEIVGDTAIKLDGKKKVERGLIDIHRSLMES